ncbi:hypothetical protein FACS1894166_01840 [Bacilli bacterium]|nr:hypothetical protein FACS1894166_01840 [Bacilli bacterium]
MVLPLLGTGVNQGASVSLSNLSIGIILTTSFNSLAFLKVIIPGIENQTPKLMYSLV